MAAPLSAAALTSCAAARSGPGQAPSSFSLRQPPREFRAVWVASVDNIDWPSRPGLDPDAQRAEATRILDLARRLEINTIFLQVRPTADALYPSVIEPWSAFLTGRQGEAPKPAYDPLAHWIDEAHARGIDLHAWVNPFRARHPKSIGPDAPGHVSRMFPKLVRNYNGHLWLDPGAVQAREIALRVIDDLLTRYELDGVHMDDYFYPYPKPGEPFPDQAIYTTYRRNGGTLEHDAWRRENINRFVQGVNALVHARRPGALFTVSPFGIWRPGNPAGVKGFDAYAGLHADSRRWLAEGWCDALMPQLYWPVASAGQPFQPLLDWWVEQRRLGRHLWPGLYLTRVRPAEEAESWEPGEILDQIRRTRETPGCTGFALFSAVGLVRNHRGVADLLASGPLSGPALTPPSPWLAAPTPGEPAAVCRTDGRELDLTITPAADGPRARRFVVQSGDAASWRGWILPAGVGGTVRTRLDTPAPVRTGEPVFVTPVGANGAAGAAVRVLAGPG